MNKDLCLAISLSIAQSLAIVMMVWIISRKEFFGDFPFVLVLFLSLVVLVLGSIASSFAWIDVMSRNKKKK